MDEAETTEIPNVSIRQVYKGNPETFLCKADILCPHCGYYAPAEGPIVAGRYALVACHRCRQAVMITAENLSHTWSSDVGRPVIDYHPKKNPTVDPLVPEEIADDYLEAQRCFLVGAWRGCAVMARRCMHSVAERFKATGRDLYEQIEDLRNRQIITPVLADQAQHVRVLGKHGAHPYDTRGNELKELEIQDAQSALDFCDFIFDQVFIQPEKIAASKKRLAKPTPTP
ncbi:MAG TPA: DUF4145 domain-containing protein [Pyrinomonadaceae bacterium]|nr:DUF4145 domain-containing protein [Pyrinomonadaceae bacterium]